MHVVLAVQWNDLWHIEKGKIVFSFKETQATINENLEQ